ncbi:hypothetical protein [Arhodomonas sp. AD133]|uniref:hypothetical protein n=1 Tax=Arhodomonas sp. AD133 TaxID=3415009 RepID=UPI003EBB8678
MNRRDWRQVTADDVRTDLRELRYQLIPVLSADAMGGAAATDDCVRRLAGECRDALSMVLPLADAEREFLDRLLDHGEMRGDLLGLDEQLLQLVQRRPALLWKAHHARGRVS